MSQPLWAPGHTTKDSMLSTEYLVVRFAALNRLDTFVPSTVAYIVNVVRWCKVFLGYNALHEVGGLWGWFGSVCTPSTNQ